MQCYNSFARLGTLDFSYWCSCVNLSPTFKKYSMIHLLFWIYVSNQISTQSKGEELKNPLIDALVEALESYGASDESTEKTAIQAAVRRLKEQTRGDLDLEDMSVVVKRCLWHRRVRSYGYLLVIPLLSLFYLIPSFQLVYAEWAAAQVKIMIN